VVRRIRLALGWCAAIPLLAAGSARGVTIQFSDASSDTTPASWLSATFGYSLLDPQTLELSVRNDTSAAAPFDIPMIFFNKGPEVSYIQLVSAVSSVEGDNTAAWRLGYYGYDLATTLFGYFDYSLRTDPGGPGSDRIRPGETETFRLSVFCASYIGCDDGLLDAGATAGSPRASRCASPTARRATRRSAPRSPACPSRTAARCSRSGSRRSRAGGASGALGTRKSFDIDPAPALACGR